QAAGDHRVAHSNEDYGRAKPDEIASIVKDLGCGRPHVVSVVRRLDGLLPSYWQERVKAREARPYEQWLELVLAERPTGWQWFNVNYPHDVRGVVDRWGREVGEENITLIVADGRDRGLLPRTFEGLLGLPAGTLTLEESDGNRSLTYNEAEMLRRFNIIFGERGWSEEAYAEYVQRGIVPGLRSEPAADDHVKIPGVPQWAHERIRELAERQADAVRDSGVRVVGDPEELREVGDPSFGDTRELQLDLDTAARMAGGLVDQSLRLRGRTQREVRRVERRRLAGQKKATVGETASLDLLRVVGRRARNRLRRK
ncbi:MAG: hypothetical protein L0H93_14255, partial [Nocardioides sp.]|nr:hypothetical protein [Nocardioides sp.]